MKKHLLAMVAAGALCIGGGTAWAHHPFAAEYDANKPAQLEGRVVAVEWTNPHAFLTVEGRADNGARDRGGSSSAVQRRLTSTAGTAIWCAPAMK